MGIKSLLFEIRVILTLLGIMAAPFLTPPAHGDAVEPKKGVVCAVYISGIGCGNCAKTDPILLVELTSRYPRLVVFEYEIYKTKQANTEIKSKFFSTYLKERSPGVPFLVFNETDRRLGRLEVSKAEDSLKKLRSNPFPAPQGGGLDFSKLNIPSLPGKVNIWTKDRILLKEGEGRASDQDLKDIILAETVPDALAKIDFKKVDPIPIPISRSEITFEHAVKVGDWRLQWNGSGTIIPERSGLSGTHLYGLLIVLMFLGMTLSLFRLRKTSKGKGTVSGFRLELRGRMRDVLIAAGSFLALVAFFLLAKDINPEALKQAGYTLPLPVFTFLIALVDGFNPCNMFVLTCLLALLISSSSSRIRLYAVAFSFVAMVYVFYFLFMAAWLNVFKYISFITPLRIGIAVIALIAGIINCKELFFFKKGISLTIQEKHKGPLMQRIDRMKDIIAHGSFPVLILSSLGLASLASLVELPCTAGFPIIYTGILSGKGFSHNFLYYTYLAFYNLVYVLPLLTIIIVFIYSFRARPITQRHMEIIKFVGGIIMILLGIVLLVSPGLLGLNIG